MSAQPCPRALTSQGCVRVWETIELRPLCELQDPRFSAAIRGLAVTPDDSSLLTGDDGNCTPPPLLTRVEGRIIAWGRSKTPARRSGRVEWENAAVL